MFPTGEQLATPFFCQACDDDLMRNSGSVICAPGIPHFIVQSNGSVHEKESVNEKSKKWAIETTFYC